MKVGLIAAGGLLLFVVVAAALWRTVGGLVEQAGAREERAVMVEVDVRFADAGGAPIADMPLRVVLGPAPQEQPASAGEAFVTDASGAHAFTTRATIDKTPRARPAGLVDRLFAKAQQTDHVSAGVELSGTADRRLYVVDLYRFADGVVVWPDGLTVFSRDGQGRLSSAPAREPGSTGLGHQLTEVKWEPNDAPETWRLSLVFRQLGR